MYNNFESLQQHGLCIIPVPEELLNFCNGNLEESFDQSIQRQPELRDITGQLVGGGFAALANPSSFHDEFPRRVRSLVYLHLKQLFNENCPQYRLWKKEIVPDRMLQREPTEKPIAEAWHRDLSPAVDKPTSLVMAGPDDLILGGFINMNMKYDQHFVCVPDTHHSSSVIIGDIGFHTLTEEEKRQAEERKVIVAIPPNSMLIFNQSLIHCVHSKKLPFVVKRIFISFRVSPPETTLPLIRNIETFLVNGEVIPLKSGQLPAMYPKFWLIFWPDRLIALSAKFPDYMKEKRFIRGKRMKAASGHYQVLKLIAPALPLGMFPPYSAEELAMHLPSL